MRKVNDFVNKKLNHLFGQWILIRLWDQSTAWPINIFHSQRKLSSTMCWFDQVMFEEMLHIPCGYIHNYQLCKWLCFLFGVLMYWYIEKYWHSIIIVIMSKSLLDWTLSHYIHFVRTVLACISDLLCHKWLPLTSDSQVTLEYSFTAYQDGIELPSSSPCCGCLSGQITLSTHHYRQSRWCIWPLPLIGFFMGKIFGKWKCTHILVLNVILWNSYANESLCGPVHETLYINLDSWY